ncbi:protein kinase [Actinoplanes sp. NPDC049802]|uniref:serine/threonine-protein kinase n=1 Tax=Actinoplanes sp. NPDC049802 TaxID=3154742 RepID=UPI0033D23002
MSADVVLQAGLRLSDRYRLHRRLGAGGMGEVWLAVDEVLQRTVAVKAMLPGMDADPDFARRFVAEATAMARINHPAVASIHDFGRSMGVAFLVMEFVDGESLAQRLSRGRLAPDETMRLIAHVADGLQAVHDQGLVHRDIKPANLLVRRDGTVVITDFGIARHEDAGRLTVSGAILGTPTYLSPEQVRGEPAGPLSDVYSLGLVAYECLSGEKPFVGDNPYAVALQRLQSAPRTMKVALPPPVASVVEHALAVDPRARWQSAADLAHAARATTTGPVSAAPPVPAAASPVPAAASPVPGAASPVPGAASPAPGFASPAPGFASPASGAGLPVPGVASPVSGASSRRPLMSGLVGLAALLLVVAGLVAWGSRTDDDELLEAKPGESTVEEATQEWLPVQFTTCGSAYCPVEPMCWGGLTFSSGVPESPRRLDCAEEHVWETFAALDAPAGGVVIDDDEPLMEESRVASVCDKDFMAARSHHPDKTREWLRDAWPIKVGGDTLLHCIARPVGGAATGDFFKSA